MFSALKDPGSSQVLLIAAVSAACVAQDAMLYVALPVHWQEAGLASLLQVGVLLSMNRLVRLPINPLAGWVYSKVSAKICLVCACIAAFFVAGGCAAAHTFLAWILLRAAWGVIWAFLKMGSLFTVMGVSNDSDRGYLMGLYTGTYRIGSLAGMLGGGIVADLFGLSAACCCGMALAACAALLALFRLRPSLPVQKNAGSEAPVSWKKLLFSPRFLRIILTCTLVAMTIEGFLASTLSAYLHAMAGETIVIAGAAFGCAAAAGAVQSMRWAWNPFLSPMFGRISDRSRSRGLIFAACCLITAALFALCALSMPLPALFLMLVGIELGATALTSLSDALAADLASTAQTVFVITAYTFAIDLGAALGPMGGYFLVTAFGIEHAYAAAGAVLALMGLMWIKSRRPAPAGA